MLNKQIEFVSERSVDVKTKIIHQPNITQHLALTLLVSSAMPQVQLLNGRDGIIYNHSTEMMVGMRIFAMTLCCSRVLLTLQIAAQYFSGGAGGASDNVGRDIFPVT